MSQINFNTSRALPLYKAETILFVVKQTETRKPSLIFECGPDLDPDVSRNLLKDAFYMEESKGFVGNTR